MTSCSCVVVPLFVVLCCLCHSGRATTSKPFSHQQKQLVTPSHVDTCRPGMIPLYGRKCKWLVPVFTPQFQHQTSDNNAGLFKFWQLRIFSQGYTYFFISIPNRINLEIYWWFFSKVLCPYLIKTAQQELAWANWNLHSSERFISVLAHEAWNDYLYHFFICILGRQSLLYRDNIKMKCLHSP